MISFDYKSDSINIFGNQIMQDEFRNYLIDNYPFMVKNYITKVVVSGDTKTIQSATKKVVMRRPKKIVVDWEGVYANCIKTSYIMTEFILYLKRNNKWISAS